jgi:uncharacterized protein YndB with AHSA1/START domain
VLSDDAAVDLADEPEVVHGTVSVSRTFPVPPSAVFSGFSSLDRRAAWFRVPGTDHRDLDFRVGGGETLTASTRVSGRLERIEYRSRFVDIVTDRRIVFQYGSRVDGRAHAAALVTVELREGGDGTDLTYTDQHVLYVHTDVADRATTVAHHQGAIRLMLNGLGVVARGG